MDLNTSLTSWLADNFADKLTGSIPGLTPEEMDMVNSYLVVRKGHYKDVVNKNTHPKVKVFIKRMQRLIEEFKNTLVIHEMAHDLWRES